MQSIMMPPDRYDGRGPMSSVVALTIAQGGVVEHPEFVVYDKSASLPEYAIYYRHTPACKCTHCC